MRIASWKFGKFASRTALVLSFSLFALSSESFAIGVTNKAGASRAVTALQKLINQDLRLVGNLPKDAQLELANLKQANDSTLAKIESDYAVLKAASSARTSRAIDSVNKYSYFKVEVSNLGRCNGNCAVGTVLNLPFTPADEQSQREIDQNVKAGAMTPQDKGAYDASRLEYSKSLEDALASYSKYLQAKTDASNLSSASVRLVESKYEAAKRNADEKLSWDKKVLLSAKRALSSGSNFESSFKTAYFFEYNLTCSYQVANSSFSSINSYMSAVSVVSAMQDYQSGYAISLMYSTAKASSFNKRLTGAYTTDPIFLKDYNKALNLYRNSST